MVGLAVALKRKLGAGAANGHQKRPRSAAGTAQDAAELGSSEAIRQLLANSGFAALAASATSTNTRTALRKQRKAEQQARQQARLTQQQQQQRQPDGSDSEDEAVQADGGSQHCEAAQRGAGPVAYSRLLGSLSAAGGAHAGALQQRQREHAGDSDASSSEQDEDEQEEEEEEEESMSASEGDDGDGGLEEEEPEAAGVAEGLGELASGSEGDSGSEGEGHSSSDEEEQEETQGGEAAAQQHTEQQQDQQRPRHLSDRPEAAGEAGWAGAAEDHYLSHFDSALSEERAAALLDAAQRTRYLPCSPAGGKQGSEQGPAVAGDVLSQWPEAGLEAVQGSRMPQSAPAHLAAYGVKERLAARWREVAATHAAAGAAAAAAAAAGGGGSTGSGDFVDGQQRALFALLSTYTDLLVPCRPYPTSADAPDPQMDAVLLHVLSHCAKAADRIKKNNDRLKAGPAGAAAGVDAVAKDQGFTRAKVLLLLPQRNLALRVVRRLLELAVKETRSDTIKHKQRFLDEFGEQDEALSEREAAAVARKPADHQALFGGNLDDHFRLGIKLTRGAVKLFADFFDSDIIVASPLALATRLAEAEAGGEGEGASDFLSSVEVLVAERADLMLMQNWAHVGTVFEAVNQIPREGHGVDMMRVRDWALSGRGALYRQTVLLSSFASAEMNALLARTCRNHAGKARLAPSYRGVLGEVIPRARQVFERLPAAAAAAAAATDADARFEHFKRCLWPRIRESGGGGGHLIYLPSYFDYVRVRNFLRGELASFLGLCEYTERADAARARAYFFDRRKQVLLYTERAQFYNRHRIRGARNILFYQLPEHAGFYSELLNLLEEAETGETPTVTVVFSKVDALRLERVVGSDRSCKMLKAKKTSTFLFC